MPSNVPPTIFSGKVGIEKVGELHYVYFGMPEVKPECIGYYWRSGKGMYSQAEISVDEKRIKFKPPIQSGTLVDFIVMLHFYKSGFPFDQFKNLIHQNDFIS